MDDERQTGRTTNQMLNAPSNSIYVWVNNHLDYPRRLAYRLGRSDLKIVRVDGLKDAVIGGHESVVIDHCAYVDENIRSILRARIYPQETKVH